MSDCFVLYLLLTCMKKKTSGADKFTNNIMAQTALEINILFLFVIKVKMFFIIQICNNNQWKVATTITSP